MTKYCVSVWFDMPEHIPSEEVFSVLSASKLRGAFYGAEAYKGDGFSGEQEVIYPFAWQEQNNLR